MKCIYCNKIVKLNFFSFFDEDFLLCDNCLNKLEFSFFKDDSIIELFNYNDFIKDFLLDYDKGDYALLFLFKDFLQFYINNYLDCKDIVFFNCEFLRQNMNLELKGNKRYIFVIFLDDNILEEIYLKYSFNFIIITLFASEKFINQRKKLLKMI